MESNCAALVEDQLTLEKMRRDAFSIDHFFSSGVAALEHRVQSLCLEDQVVRKECAELEELKKKGLLTMSSDVSGKVSTSVDHVNRQRVECMEQLEVGGCGRPTLLAFGSSIVHALPCFLTWLFFTSPLQKVRLEHTEKMTVLAELMV